MKFENIIKRFGAATLVMFATKEGLQAMYQGKDNSHLIEEYYPYVHEMKGVNAYNIRIITTSERSDDECTTMLATEL